MPTAPNPLRGLEQTADRLQKALAAAGEQSVIPAPLLEPFRLQAEFFQQAVRRQSELEARMTASVEPLRELLESMERAPEAMRDQANALDSAAASLSEAAKTLRVQAGFTDLAVSAMTGRLPASREPEATARGQSPDS